MSELPSVICRLNIPSSPPGSKPSSPSTSTQLSRKRKLVDTSDTATTAASSQHGSSKSYVTVSTADVGIEIRDVDADAKFIRLYNNSNAVIPLTFF